MKKYKSIYALILCLITLGTTRVMGGNTPQWTDVSIDVVVTKFEAINNCFIRQRNYSVNVTDESFASYTSTIYHQRFSGYFKRGKDGYHSLMGSMQTIQNKECRMLIDTVKKLVMIADPTDYMNQVLSVKDYSKMLKICSKVKMMEANGLSTYRLEFDKGYPLTAYEITLKDSLPQKIVIYYSKAVKGDHENNIEKPRLEVQFDNWSMNTQLDKGNFILDKYLVKQGDKYSLKPPYSSGYKLLDERVLTRKEKT